ncbi:T9SS type A sorting domain-containing protein [Epilithonimonas mollis]|uniref:Por secretion system C-terminal sorting domain-containing protein n=1 Tax=Epilithonimonas mollis TaxID=216903 RepID=A0A1M6RK51_9FLAO|nr:T9SS type A sorting domain-containing protein [Epilithonimonas mollis]SHK32819.1 Por secretion system C-terminal sorting domain-containing protein [Epilithonimonas mollis]
MKKFYSMALAAFAGVALSAQLTYTVSNGIYKLTYGKSGDWSFYDPQGAPTIYVHVWSAQSDGDNNQGNFDDAWTNSNTTMVWDNAEGAFVGTINLNTKLFTNSNTTMPQGAVVQRIGIVLKDQQNGTSAPGRQSADKDLDGPTTLSTMSVSDFSRKAKSQVAAGKLFTAAKGNLALTVYESGGRIVKTLKVNANGNPIDLGLSQKGVYLITISGENISDSVKFAY